MSKVTTAIIKAALDARFGSYKWKRLTKRKFEYKNVTAKIFSEGKYEFVPLNGKLNWRVYRDSDFQTDAVIVIDDGEEIKLMTMGEEVLPSSCFQFGAYFSEECETVGFTVIFKEEFEDSFPDDSCIYGDNLREESIAGLEKMMNDSGFIFESDRENVFSVMKKFSESGKEIMESAALGNLIDHVLLESDVDLIKGLIEDFGLEHNDEIDEDFY